MSNIQWIGEGLESVNAQRMPDGGPALARLAAERALSAWEPGPQLSSFVDHLAQAAREDQAAGRREVPGRPALEPWRRDRGRPREASPVEREQTQSVRSPEGDQGQQAAKVREHHRKPQRAEAVAPPRRREAGTGKPVDGEPTSGAAAAAVALSGPEAAGRENQIAVAPHPGDVAPGNGGDPGTASGCGVGGSQSVPGQAKAGGAGILAGAVASGAQGASRDSADRQARAMSPGAGPQGSPGMRGTVDSGESLLATLLRWVQGQHLSQRELALLRQWVPGLADLNAATLQNLVENLYRMAQQGFRSDAPGAAAGRLYASATPLWGSKGPGAMLAALLAQISGVATRGIAAAGAASAQAQTGAVSATAGEFGLHSGTGANGAQTAAAAGPWQQLAQVLAAKMAGNPSDGPSATGIAGTTWAMTGAPQGPGMETMAKAILTELWRCAQGQSGPPVPGLTGAGAAAEGQPALPPLVAAALAEAKAAYYQGTPMTQGAPVQSGMASGAGGGGQAQAAPGTLPSNAGSAGMGASSSTSSAGWGFQTAAGLAAAAPDLRVAPPGAPGAGSTGSLAVPQAVAPGTDLLSAGAGSAGLSVTGAQSGTDATQGSVAAGATGGASVRSTVGAPWPGTIRGGSGLGASREGMMPGAIPAAQATAGQGQQPGTAAGSSGHSFSSGLAAQDSGARSGQTAQSVAESAGAPGGFATAMGQAASSVESVPCQPGAASPSSVPGGRAEAASGNPASAHGAAAAPKEALAQASLPELADKLVSAAKLAAVNGETRLHLQLVPETLGRVLVEMTLRHGQLQANFLVDNAQARQALEARLPELQQSWQQQGLQVGQMAVQVGQQSAGWAQQFAQPWQAWNSGAAPATAYAAGERAGWAEASVAQQQRNAVRQIGAAYWLPDGSLDALA